MEGVSVSKSEWTLSAEALGRFLAGLDPDSDRAGEKYESLRLALMKFFDWRGAHFPEDLADETIKQRHEREIEDQLAAEREQNGRLKAELDRLLGTLAPKPPQSPPSIISFLLRSILSPRGASADRQQITIQRGTDLVRLQMVIANGDSRRFQASIRAVGGSQVWSRRSLKPRSGAITVNVPADKLPMNDYILTLSATNPTGETEEINRYTFRVLR